MTIPQLKAALRRSGLPVSGRKHALLARVEEMNDKVLQNCSAGGMMCEGEFDWVVPQMGGLHQEFMLCRSFLDVNWDVAYKGFDLSEGYHGQRQLLYIRSGKDHH